MIQVGSVYKHYKGDLYRVIAIAKHSETLEEMVVYQQLYGDGGIWCRPAKMWNEIVGNVKRFQISNQQSNHLGHGA